MLSSPALDGSRESPCVEEHESAGPGSRSTKTVRRKGLLSMFAIPFADFSVGIETILLIECGPYALNWLGYLQTSGRLSHGRRGTVIARWSEGWQLGK